MFQYLFTILYINWCCVNSYDSHFICTCINYEILLQYLISNMIVERVHHIESLDKSST